MGQDTCNIFHSSPFPLQFPTTSTLCSPSRSQFWRGEKHKSRPEGGRNESRMEMETSFLIFFLLSNEKLTHFGKRQTHHIELVSRNHPTLTAFHSCLKRFCQLQLVLLALTKGESLSTGSDMLQMESTGAV